MEKKMKNNKILEHNVPINNIFVTKEVKKKC